MMAIEPAPDDLAPLARLAQQLRAGTLPAPPGYDAAGCGRAVGAAIATAQGEPIAAREVADLWQLPPGARARAAPPPPPPGACDPILDRDG